MGKYTIVQQGLLLHLFCWLLIYCCFFIFPALSKAQSQPGFFSENYFVGQTLGDGKDGRVNYTWKQKIGERPINNVILKVRKQGNSATGSITVSFENGSTLGKMPTQSVTSKEISIIEWPGDKESPQGRRLVIAANGGHIFLESVIIDAASTWEETRPRDNYLKEEHEIKEIYEEVKKHSALEQEKTKQENDKNNPLFGEKAPW